MSDFVTHLESAIDGTRLEKGKVWSIHQGRPIWVRYDLPAVALLMLLTGAAALLARRRRVPSAGLAGRRREP